MKQFTSVPFLATVASCALVSAAEAQVTTPGQTATTGNDSAGTQFALLATGPSSVGTVLVKEAACANGSDSAPDCGDNPKFALLYEAEGSRFGRQQWRNLTNQWTVAGLVNSQVVAPNVWNHVQFAFDDSTPTQGDLATYATTVRPTGGAGIMFPKYVLPVAIAYNPVYGKNSMNDEMRFNVRVPKSIGPVNVGGLPLSRELYCGIFNGQIKNFNDARFATANSGVPLFDTSKDTLPRWTSDGLPIRLVGRVDRSGTTDIFTRALANQCSGFGYPNKYNRTDPAFGTIKLGAETLPYDRTPGANVPNFSSVRPDTGLNPSSSEPTANGTTAGLNSVGNQYFNGTAIASVAGGLPSNPTGSVGSGLFLVADGSGRVRDTINLAPDYVLGAVTLNGKIGYIGADFLANVPGQTLFAAALQAGATATYNVPSSGTATAMLQSINPPESNASGTYTNTDTRQVRNPAGPAGSLVPADRANPLAWYDVLYTGTTILSNPTAATSYPITGTAQFYGYTCYTARNRPHVVYLLAYENRAVLPLPVQLIIANSNLGLLPANWSTAINETFLKNSTQAAGGQVLGALNLWIQNQYAASGSSANSTCTGAGM